MLEARGVLEAHFCSVWVGRQLLPIANACINSFRSHGHRFSLYTYGLVEDVPEFVERRNAEDILPAAAQFHAHGGWETFADQFAYQFLKKRGGWWVDNDVVCNADVVPVVDIAFAEERVGVINNAVLKFPPSHPAIESLLNYVATVDPVTAQWGATGPLALTKIFNQLGLDHHKMRIEDFYPLHWREAPKLLFPEFTEEVLEKTKDSPFIHLWGATLRELVSDFGDFLPIEGSYLNRFYKENLDHCILARLTLRPEEKFRRDVREYVKASWNEDLAIRT